VRVEIKRNCALIEYKNLENAVEAREKMHNTKLGDLMLVVGYQAHDRDRQERGWGQEERERDRQKDRER
jgi:RNA recognition motif-containing protein